MSGDAERVSGDVEDLTPKHTFQLEVLISSSEQGVPLHGVASINLVIHRIVNDLTEDSLIILTINLEEELMALILLHHVV